MQMLVKSDDITSGAKANTCHGLLQPEPAQESMDLTDNMNS